MTKHFPRAIMFSTLLLVGILAVYAPFFLGSHEYRVVFAAKKNEEKNKENKETDKENYRTYQPNIHQSEIYTPQNNVPQNVQGTAALSISQQVRNRSSGNSTWSNSISVHPSDTVEFNITIQNSGNGTINTITVKDTLPANLSYKDNLTIDGIGQSGDITSSITIASIPAGKTVTITYQAQVAPDQNFSSQPTTLNNFVTVTSGQKNLGTASAFLLVTKTSSDTLPATDNGTTTPTSTATLTGSKDFLSVFQSVFGSPDIYQYIGFPKYANVFLVVVGILSGLGAIAIFIL